MAVRFVDIGGIVKLLHFCTI